MYLLDEIKELDRTARWNPTFQMLHLDTRKMVEGLTQKVAKLPQNRTLNRYRDVLPYDETRVRLKTGNNDYINANYVEVPKIKRKYILTQGPLPLTAEDFWRMIWENNTKGIIMLNRIVEKNMIKCHPYWPMGEDEELEFGDFHISNHSCEMKSSFIVRELLLLHSPTGDSRIVKQFHYVMWPDFGVPQEPESFLEFLDDIKKSDVLDPNAPPVVHCSAGIGRSGTFCLVDAALALAVLNNSIDDIEPQQILLSMRKYRCGLVQTAEQLRFANIAIVYGLYSLFPRTIEDNMPSDVTNKAVDGISTDSDDDLIPPPLPPRRKKEYVPPSKPDRSAKKMVEDQAKEYQRINELVSSGEDTSDEEIIDLSDDSSDEITNDIPSVESMQGDSTSKEDIIETQEKEVLTEENNVDENILQSSIETKIKSTEEIKACESSQIRRREIQERKQNRKELVENIKKKMKDSENRMSHVWMYAGVAFGIISVVIVAYQWLS